MKNFKFRKDLTVEYENNLDRLAWIYDDDKVYQECIISENAKVFGNVQISENAKVFGNALLSKK